MTEGILIIDKPVRITSHDVVDSIRTRFGIRKVGHAGTLDPGASGLLVILLGKFTKQSSRFANDDKEYDVILRLGMRTDTHDAEGKIISEGDFTRLTDAQIKKAFSFFEGRQEQIPPMYSAVKYKGKKLYELARKGKVVERTTRAIEIYNLKISGIELPYVKFSVRCSKGTYVRQLCSDIGDRLGCGAYTHYLRRTRSGDFLIKDAVAFQELRTIDENNTRR